MNIELAHFLAADERPEGTMNYAELHGFIFSVACSPEPLKPAEWLPLVFNGAAAGYATEAEAEGVTAAVMKLFNEAERQVQEQLIELPEFCTPSDNIMENFADDAPIAHWSRGFLLGHEWLSELWDAYIPDELDEELGSSFIVLSFFAEQGLAEEYCKEAGDEGVTLALMAESVVDSFDEAAKSYANLGRAIQIALGPRTPFVREERVGRNDPCPCGSGKKFKQCCMG
jgi:yecA family protein